MTNIDNFGIKRHNKDEFFKTMNEEKEEAANKTEAESVLSASDFPDSVNEFFSVYLPGCELICGVRGAVAEIENISECLKRLNKIADKNNAYIICLNEENIAGIKHIESALFHAGRSWFLEKPISNSFEMEVLLYAGGTRQCNLAGAFGLHNGKNSLYICVCIKKDINPGFEEKHGLEKRLNKEKNQEKNSEINRGLTNKIHNEELELSFKGVDRYFIKVEDIFNQLSGFFDFSGLFNSIQVNSGKVFGSSELKKIKFNQKNQSENKKIENLMKLFDISEEEIEAVGIERCSELVLERVALLDVSK